LEVYVDQVPLQTLTAGLQALPNLTSLKLFTGYSRILPQNTYQSMLAATCGRLTRLEMATHRERLPTLLQAPPVMPKLQHLRELHIPEDIVTDDGMCALLALPSLTHVAVHSFQLTSSHSHKPCSWEKVTVYGYLDVVGSLVKLPLQGVRWLVAGTVMLGSIDDEERAAHDVAAALANIPASCHLTVHPDGRLVMDCAYGRRDEDLRQLLPVVARWEGVCLLTVTNFDDIDDDDASRLLQPDTIAAIASHLANMPSCITLELNEWVPHLAYPMLTALRPTNITRLVINGFPVEEQHLLLWCCGDAGRDMTVEVHGCHVRPKGGLQRVRAYLDQVRLNSLVRVTLLGEEIDDDSDDGSADE
jgi:hypothetical protein